MKRAGDSRCLGWRPIEGGKAGPFKWFSYKEAQSESSLVVARRHSSIDNASSKVKLQNFAATSVAR